MGTCIDILFAEIKMLETPAAIRIDVDSVQDVALLPRLLDLMELLDIQGTFFITTGPDKTALNLFRYIANPRAYSRFLKSRPLRFGFQSFNGLFRATNVEDSCEEVLATINERKHEVGLHGHDHYKWMHTLQNMDDTVIKEFIGRGIKTLETVTKARIRSFASPGFAVTDGLLRAIDFFRFDYSSDFKGVAPMPPFYPKIGTQDTEVLQLPVSMDSIGELCAQGFTERDIRSKIRVSMTMGHREGLPFVMFIHPAYEVGCKMKLLASVLQELREDPRFTFLRLAQIAQYWKVRI